MTTPQDIITTARYILNDTDAIAPRQSTTELLGYFNDGLREIAAIQPALYTEIGDLTCIINTCEQAIPYTSAQAVVDVLCIADGDAITPFDIPTMNAFNPGWRTDTGGPAVQWSKYPGQPMRFFIYPKAPATTQVLNVSYLKNATVHALTDPITEIPSSYFPPLVDYVVYRAEFKDDEHANSGRAAAAYQAFVSKVKGA